MSFGYGGFGSDVSSAGGFGSGPSNYSTFAGSNSNSRSRANTAGDDLTSALRETSDIAAAIDNTLQEITRSLPPRFWLASKGKNFCISLGYGRMSMMLEQALLRQGLYKWARFSDAKRRHEEAVKRRVKKVRCV